MEGMSTTQPAMHRIFFYGTIKSDQPNHWVLEDKGKSRYRLVGTGRTETKWPLVIATKLNCPFLLGCEGEGHFVKGEVYEIDDKLLSEIDDLEGSPDNYDRRRVLVRMDEAVVDEGETKPAGTVLECWFYVLPRYSEAKRALEMFDCYDSSGSHGKRFVKCYDRETKTWLVPQSRIRQEFQAFIEDKETA